MQDCNLLLNVMYAFLLEVGFQKRYFIRRIMSSLQFAYQAKVGVYNAIIYLLHRAGSHLEESQSTVMFFDFSSTFDTIRPSLLAEKLHAMPVDHGMVAWITYYHLLLLARRPQYVRLQFTLSDVVT